MSLVGVGVFRGKVGSGGADVVLRRQSHSSPTLSRLLLLVVSFSFFFVFFVKEAHIPPPLHENYSIVS